MNDNEPKYKRIVNYVIDGIHTGKYKKGNKIPSINEFVKEFHLSRDTIFAGIRELMSKGIIKSSPGIGYHIVSENIPFHHNIFLLFNELNEFKEDLYRSFMQSINKTDHVDIRFHHYNRRMFEMLLNDANGLYTDYIIMSGKFKGLEPLLKNLSGNVFLLDHYHPELKGHFSSVYQNFEKDTYEALVYGLQYLKKYQRIIMVQKDEKEPTERYTGLRIFCTEYDFVCHYIGTTHERVIKKGDLFMVVSDRDLADLIKQSVLQGFTPGKEFGIISYNDTPLKEVLAGGITTLSTDFTQMGKSIATLLNKKTIETIENPWSLHIRNSL
jgi:DNA-binding transcriptional regulator YhcF (GntR family)